MKNVLKTNLGSEFVPRSRVKNKKQNLNKSNQSVLEQFTETIRFPKNYREKCREILDEKQSAKIRIQSNCVP